MNKKTAWAMAALLLFTAITAAITVRRTLKGSNDFDTYYTAGKAVLKHHEIYYAGEFYKDKSEASPFLYAPVTACFFALFALFPKAPAAIIWHLFNSGAVLLAFLLCLKLNAISPVALSKQARQFKVEAILSAIVAVSLVLDNLSMAQVNVLIFCLILIALDQVRSGKCAVAGFSFSSAILFKLTPVFFAFFFLARRSWKTLLWAFFAGGLLTLIIPSLFLGLEGNRIAHRQWLGRTLKPIAARFVKTEADRDTVHPEKKTREDLEANRLDNLLIKSNQSLPGAMTRLMLKDRNQYADSTAYPIYAAQKYRKLPVVLPVPKHTLDLLIPMIQASILLAMIVLSFKVFQNPTLHAKNGLIAVYFLSLSLFSPMARTHQFVFWIFPLLTHWSWKALLPGFRTSIPFITACVLYLLQALPYGKAAGLGAFSNLVFWGYFYLLTLSITRKENIQVPA